MLVNDHSVTNEEGIEIQIFPRGMWHVIGAVVCMTASLGILLASIALLVSQWISVQAVLGIGLFLSALAVFSLVTPTFLLTRGGASWHGFLKQLNLCVVGMLAVTGAVSLFFGTTNLAGTTAVGLSFSLIACWLYRTVAHAECVEYYRRIWEYRRQHMQG